MVFWWPGGVLHCTDTQDLLVESCYATTAHPYGYTSLDCGQHCGQHVAFGGRAYINLYITPIFPPTVQFSTQANK